jgi:hypothetical protein
MLMASNENYKKILEINTKINIFRSTIQDKINAVKINIINSVEMHFKKIG